jgi:hypothetical protein
MALITVAEHRRSWDRHQVVADPAHRQALLKEKRRLARLTASFVTDLSALFKKIRFYMRADNLAVFCVVVCRCERAWVILVCCHLHCRLDESTAAASHRIPGRGKSCSTEQIGNR